MVQRRAVTRASYLLFYWILHLNKSLYEYSNTVIPRFVPIFFYRDIKDVKSANLIMNRRHKYHVDRITNTSATLIVDPRQKCHVDYEPT